MKSASVLTLTVVLLFATLAVADSPPGPSLAAQGQGPEAETISEWQARWELARLLSYDKHYEESLKEYRRVLEQKPDLQQAKVEMARVLFWAGRGDEALPLLRAVPQEALDDPTRLTLAELLISQKQYQPAESILKDYLTRHSDDLAARLKLANLLSWDKRYEASLVEFRRILEARPDDIQVRRKYAMVLIWAGQRAQAEIELRKTLPSVVPGSKR